LVFLPYSEEEIQGGEGVKIDKYQRKYIREIKDAKSDERLAYIVDCIYHDGFCDGETRDKEPKCDGECNCPDCKVKVVKK
jgi:hypothetical protein